MKIDSGVYMFRNTVNGKVYVGQSKYLRARYREHKATLLNGTHHNEYFQKAVNKYGFDAFEYTVLVRCPVDDLDRLEAYYINLYDSRNDEKGYNIREAGNDSALPDETKEKIRQSNRGHNNKLTPSQVEEIKLRRLEGVRCYELATEYGVKVSTINKITTCKNWSYVRSDLNEALLTQSQREAEERERVVKDLYHKGLRPHQIHRKAGIAEHVVVRILSTELAAEKKRAELIVRDFFDFVPLAEILTRYGVSYNQYKRITYGMKPKRDRMLYEEICRRKAEGQLQKDIAVDLGLNRTTVTDILKRFSAQANTEVNDQITKG